jgi:hypothetical protein
MRRILQAKDRTSWEAIRRQLAIPGALAGDSSVKQDMYPGSVQISPICCISSLGEATDERH